MACFAFILGWVAILLLNDWDPKNSHFLSVSAVATLGSVRPVGLSMSV